MKKKYHAILTIITAFALCCTVLAGCSRSVTQAVETTGPAAPAATSAPAEETAAKDIGLEEAKSIALKHAGTAASDVTFTQTKREHDDGGWVYEVKFHSQNTKYDYDIDASTGSVLSFEHDLEQDAMPPSMPAEETAAKDIGLEEAKSIALKHAGAAASDVTFTKMKKERDDGRWVYEVKFYNQNIKCDYDIDASTGSVLSYDHDTEHDAMLPDDAGSTNYIGIDEAKAIALNHAGLSASDISLSKAKYEDDDGRKEYEVEFYYNGMEYEYAIDAFSGNIVAYDIERDD